MHTRYVITLGATTTAGGEVISANDFKTVEGVPVALEGDKCWCPQCQSEGLIRPQGPRVSATIEGREIALHDDLCICACTPPPRLIAAQTFKSQSVDGDLSAAASSSCNPAPSRPLPDARPGPGVPNTW